MTMQVIEGDCTDVRVSIAADRQTGRGPRAKAAGEVRGAGEAELL